MKKYCKETFAALGESLLGFARFNELEADRAAFYNACKADYNPYALTGAMNRFKREEKESEGHSYSVNQVLVFLFASHPPTTQRMTVFAWEANFVKMPPKTDFYINSAFDAMKAKVINL